MASYVLRYTSPSHVVSRKEIAMARREVQTLSLLLQGRLSLFVVSGVSGGLMASASACATPGNHRNA
jgi:hypothetical protein